MFGWILGIGAALGLDYWQRKQGGEGWIGHLTGGKLGGKSTPKVTTKLTPGKLYAMNVIANTQANAVAVNNAVIGVTGGALWTGVGKDPVMAKTITEFPGVDLTAYGGTANQWIVYVRAQKFANLPLQVAPTLYITSAFPADTTINGEFGCIPCIKGE